MVIPLVVAFLGASLGTYATISTSSDTIQAERDRAVEQFRRDQRRDQYAAILQQATRLQNASSFSSTAVGSLGLTSGLYGLGQYARGGTAATGGLDGGGETTTVLTPKITAEPSDRETYGDLMEETIDRIKADKYGLTDIRDTWQAAYTGLDQAISNSEIASSRQAINLARALRDRYRNEYSQSVLEQIDETINFYPDPKPDRLKLAESLVGVPPDQEPPTYDTALLTKSTDELTAMYVQAAKSDLGLDDR